MIPGREGSVCLALLLPLSAKVTNEDTDTDKTEQTDKLADCLTDKDWVGISLHFPDTHGKQGYAIER